VHNHLSLDAVDSDGAIREAAEAAGVDRRNFLRKGAIAGGGIVASTAMFSSILSPAEAAISSRHLSKKNDIKILNFALTLEFLEAEFYTQAEENNVAGDDLALARFNKVVAAHERNHVSFLKGALGSKAISKPDFDFGKAVKERDAFRVTSQVLEDTGVRAYLGQAANVFQRPFITAAGKILTVEARHASWIRFLNGGGAPNAETKFLPAPNTFDKPASARFILAAVADTGFIQ